MVDRGDALEREFLRQWYSLVGDRVSCVVGFSGGADSTALLFLLYRVRSFFRSFSVVAYHLHHGLRQTADRDEAFCVSFCERLGIPLVVEREDVKRLAREHHLSLEEAGRLRRREGYERIRKQYGLDWICLGHHRDDQVEGFFLRLFRGGGLASLSGMRPKEGFYLRPLLVFSHRDLVEYLTHHGQTWCEDESNQETVFERNWVRHELLPLIEDRFPGVRDKVIRLENFLGSLTEMIEKRLDELREGVEFFPGGWRVPVEFLISPGEFWVRELVRTLWREEGMLFVRGDWLQTIRLYGDREQRTLLHITSGGLFLDAKWLTWVRWEDLRLPSEVSLTRGERVVCGPWEIEWQEGSGEVEGFPRSTRERMFLPLSIEHVVIRPVQPGDRIGIKGGHKKIQDLWVDAHVPWLERRWSLVVEHEGMVVALYVPGVGFRVSREWYLEDTSSSVWQALRVWPSTRG